MQLPSIAMLILHKSSCFRGSVHRTPWDSVVVVAVVVVLLVVVVVVVLLVVPLVVAPLVFVPHRPHWDSVAVVEVVVGFLPLYTGAYFGGRQSWSPAQVVAEVAEEMDCEVVAEVAELVVLPLYSGASFA